MITAPFVRPAPLAGNAAARVFLAWALLGLAGCGAASDLYERVFSRGGLKLAAPLKVGDEQAFRALIESTMPAGKSGTSAAVLSLSFKIRYPAAEPDGWFRAEGEVTDGKEEVDGKTRPLPLAGQKFSFSYGPLRRIAHWNGLPLPTGAELLDVAPPKGRVKAGERWKADVQRLLLQQQESVALDKSYACDGERALAGVPCIHLTASIPPAKHPLASGAVLEFSGTGEAWISQRDGRLLKVTEVLDGQLTDEKAGAAPGRFTHAETLVDATLPAPAPAGVPAAAPPGAAPAPPPATTSPAGASAKAAVPAAPSATDLMAERLVYVSGATGKREVWSLAEDGSNKRCLTGFAAECWAPALDPAGGVLACAGGRGGGTNAWLVALGGGTTPLTQFAEATDMKIGWAAGGSRLALVRNGQLWLCERDGYNLQTVKLDGEVADLAASPASTRVVLVTNTLNQNRIVTVDVGSGVVHEIAEGDHPAYSPDAMRVAYRGPDGIVVMQADGSAPATVVKGPVADAPVAWDPAGAQLGYTAHLSDGTAVMTAPVPPGGSPALAVRGGTAQCFAPDGKRIAYLAQGDLWIAKLDGSALIRLTTDGTALPPVWWGKHRVP